MPLTTSQRQRAKALAHPLNPAVVVGQSGVTEPVLDKTREELALHELIKVRVNGEGRAEAKAAGELLATGTGAEIVQVIGKMVVLYKRRAEKPEINLDRG